jgi:formiminotetrahydrofolate cyclodeaminase
MFDRKTLIDAFLAASAAKQPAPGGGAAAALTGALAASMGEMVVNYSIGKKGLEAHQAELKAVLHELTRVREVMLGLMEDDQTAYAALTAAKKLPEGSPERKEQLPAALVASIRTPQAVGAAALATLDLAERVVPKVNKWLLSDLAVCVDLATATVRSAIYNVRANLPDVTDPAERSSLDWAAVQMLGKAIDTAKRVAPTIWARHSETKG